MSGRNRPASRARPACRKRSPAGRRGEHRRPAAGGQAHPVIGLWPVRVRDELRGGLVGEGVSKVDVWTARYGVGTVPFAEEVSGLGPGLDPCFNAKRPEDLDRGAALIGRSEIQYT